jgi:S1-C subfamily serine protease
VLRPGGRTAEISQELVRAARPEECPPPPKVGVVRGPVRLGCEISVDEQRYVFVEFVYPGSLGERIGLQPATRILKVNGEEIHSAADYDRASQRLGGNLRLLVQRYRMDYPEMLKYEDPRNARRAAPTPR